MFFGLGLKYLQDASGAGYSHAVYYSPAFKIHIQQRSEAQIPQHCNCYIFIYNFTILDYMFYFFMV